MLASIKDSKYFYIHIPRTSGTDIEIQLCKKYYPEINWPHCGPHKCISNLLLGQYKDSKGYWHCATHFTNNELHSLLEELNTNIDSFFTIIRNPIDRAASLYRFWRFESEKLFLDYLYSINIDDLFYNGIKCNKLRPKIYIQHRRYHFLSQYAYLYPFDAIQVFRFDQSQELNKLLNINRIYSIETQIQNRLLNLKLFHKDTIGHLVKIYNRDFDYLKYTTQYNESSDF